MKFVPFLLASVSFLVGADGAPEARKLPPSVVSEDQTGTPAVPAGVPTKAAQAAAVKPTVAAAAVSLAPPTLSGKAHAWLRDGFGPGAIIGAGFATAASMASPRRNYPSDWRQGPSAVGRNFGSFYGQIATGYSARFAVSALFHEDTRYSPSTTHNVLARFGHAIGFTFADRSDSGKRRLAVANFAGALAAGQIKRTYLPAGFNDHIHANTATIFAFSQFVMSNIAEEFRPERKRLARKLHLPGCCK